MPTTEIPPHVMSTFDVISFVASIASLILAVGAIWLSIVFYKMSTQASNATTEAAKGIAASVERLEKLFDKLYSDTFSMMRETVTDMRKHMWPTESEDTDKVFEEAEKKADEKVAELKRTMEQEVGSILQKQKIADEKLASVRAEMRSVLDKAISSSRQVENEAREETIREHIIRALATMRRRYPHITTMRLIERLTPEFPPTAVIRELERLKEERQIILSDEQIGPETIIRLISHRVSPNPESEP